MPNVRAFRSGNWSDTSLTTSPWASGGSIWPPQPGDYVYSNSFTIFVTGAINVGVSNASTAAMTWRDNRPATVASVGGTFFLQNNTTITGNITGFSGTSAPTVSLTAYGSAFINGNILGSVNPQEGNINVTNDGPGTLYINGNIFGSNIAGAVRARNGAVGNIKNGKIVFTGNIFGGSTNSGRGINNIGNGLVIVTGDVYGGGQSGGVGVSSFRNGSIVIYGDLYSGDTNAVATSDFLAIVVHLGNTYTSPITQVTPIFAKRVLTLPQTSKAVLLGGGLRPSLNYDSLSYFYTGDTFNTFSSPPLSAVREGVTYGAGTLVGTCAVPPASAVTFGVGYDTNKSRVGIAYNTRDIIFNTAISTLSANNSIGVRLKKTATIESLGHIIASFSN